MHNTWWISEDDLNEQQRGIIDLDLETSHLIVGPSGSGKTNLLLLRGSQMVLSNKPNILVIVFTRTLREFLVTGGHQYSFGEDKILTHSRWCSKFLWDHGIRDQIKDEDFEKVRKARIDQIKAVISSQSLAAVYDAIILDEAQDYHPEEIEIFRVLGRAVFAAADARQRIYSTKAAAVKALEEGFKPHVYKLKHHYRNGEKICRLADEIAKPWTAFPPLIPTSNYNEALNPSSVDEHGCPDLAGQVDLAVKSLQTQIKAYPRELLGVLCPNREVLKEVSDYLKGSLLADQVLCQSANDGYLAFDEMKPICVSTIHGAKGLEFRTVHLLGMDRLKDYPLSRNVVYTAVTRAKTSLSIYFTGNLPPMLESALAAGRPAKKPANLKQIFGQKLI